MGFGQKLKGLKSGSQFIRNRVFLEQVHATYHGLMVQQLFILFGLMREEEKTKMENSDNNNNLGYRIQIIVNTKVIQPKKLPAKYLK